MLNARLYRTAWLVAGVAVVVALLTLQPRAAAPEPAVPPAVDGALVRESADNLQGFAPVRVAGSPITEDRAARWVERQLQVLAGARGAGAEGRVRRQEFLARQDGALVPMTNVYMAVPGPDDGVRRPGIVVIAPRDTPVGIASGAASTALMIELARLTVTSAHRRPMLFVSTSGSAVGNAGVRWFLSRFSDFKIAAAVVLDGAAEGDGPTWVWAGGRNPAQALELDAIARSAVERAGGEPAPVASVWTQLLRLAVPQSFGEQAPIVAAGIPAVTLSGRPDSPARSAPIPDEDRLTQAGNAALGLMAALDEIESVPTPSAAVVLAEKDLRPGVLRIVLLLLALPLVVAAVDALARLRRARVRTGPGLRAVAWRGVPLVAAAFALNVLALAGLVPPPAAGQPPLPADVPFTARGGLALALALAAGAVAWMFARSRARRAGAAPASEAAAGLLALAALVVLAWVVSPFVLVLALPAAHAVLVATSVHRRWQLVALAGVAVLPLVALCTSVGAQLDRDPFFAAWYLLATTAEGARGVLGPLLGLALAACIWSVAALVALRARKGLVGAPAPRRPRRRRRARPARAAATSTVPGGRLSR